MGDVGDEMLTFSPESPLFFKRCHDYEKEHLKLNDYLIALCKQMKQYTRDILKASKSCEALHVYMRDGMTASKVHPRLNTMMSKLADVFSDIASSQEILAESLCQSFVMPIEDFCNHEVPKVSSLYQQYKKDRSVHSEAIIKYLQSDASAGVGKHSSGHQVRIDMNALGVVRKRRKFELARLDLITGINDLIARKNFDVAESCLASMIALRTHHHFCAERLQSSDKYINELNKQQQEQRVDFNLSRMQIANFRSNAAVVLNAMVERVENQVSVSLDDLNHLESSAPVDVDVYGSPIMSASSKDDDVSTAASTLSRIGSFGVNFVLNNTGFGRQNSAVSASSAISARSRSNEHLSATGIAVGNHITNSSPHSGGTDDEIVSWNLEDIEANLKALDKSELENLYVFNGLEEHAGMVKQGYILEKSPNKILHHAWTREWLVIDDTKMYILKEKDNGNLAAAGGTVEVQVQVVCDTMLATVRELKSSEMPFGFMLVFANLRTFAFQTEGAKEYTAWVSAIRCAIEKRLIGGLQSAPSLQHHISPSSSASNLSGAGSQQRRSRSVTPTKISDITAVASSVNSESAVPFVFPRNFRVSEQRRKEITAGLVAEIMLKNAVCAECSKNDPDWVSLNLGVVICIDCSGVHRSLGVHISKVRSLSLDNIEPEECALIARLGNHALNVIWEARLFNQEEYRKPSPQDTYTARDRYIRAKYERKFFLNLSPGLPILNKVDFDRMMASDDVATLMRRIIMGLDVNAVYKELEVEYADRVLQTSASAGMQANGSSGVDGNVSSFSPAVSVLDASSSSEDAVAAVKLLPSHHPPVRSLTPLHAAAEHGALGCLVLLLMNGAALYAKTTTQEAGEEAKKPVDPDASLPADVGLTPLQLALAAEMYDAVVYLKRKEDMMK